MTSDLQTKLQLETNIRKSTGWIMAFSVGLMLLGLLAILMPAIASAFFTSVIGWITLAGGIVMIVQSFQSKPIRGFWLNLLIGLFYVVCGAYILFNVRTAVLALTLALGILLIAEGITTIILALTGRAGHQMSWLVALNGIVTLILGIMVINRFPSSALWLIGLYMGISLLMRGMALLLAALAVRRSSALLR